MGAQAEGKITVLVFDPMEDAYNQASAALKNAVKPAVDVSSACRPSLL